jgi:2-aminoethylphosphonate transport system ATP-binding protein
MTPPSGAKSPATDMSIDLAISGAASAVPLVVGDVAQSGEGIIFENVTVAYRGHIVLEKFSLDVRIGEIMALIGPSGSGKTTALRAVAGFVQPVKGRIRIGSQDVTELPPYARGIGMVVQNYALFPHMRIEDNVAFGLRARKASREKIQQRVTECLRLVGMSKYVGRYPRELSGGQQQRIAVARALAIEPRVLLLDEPLSALDAQIRRQMVDEIGRLHRDLPTLTVLYVTHDQTEALTLADRIAIMHDGKLSSLGPSQSLYRRPPNRFTAEFLGRANLLPVRVGQLDRATGLLGVQFAGTSLQVSHDPNANSASDHLVCVRPHALHIAGPDTAGNRLKGTVEEVQWQGDHHVITLDCAGTVVRLVTKPLRDRLERGVSLDLTFDPDDATLIGTSG